MESQNLKFAVLNIKDILPSGNNPRHVNKTSQPFLDLVESIKGGGVRVPVMVRSHPKQKDKYELLAGNRRLAAAEIVKLETIPSLVNGNISDEDAFDITFFENFGREDLSPLEEFEAAEIMLKKYKGDIKAAASRMGKNSQWVAQRAAMGDKLCKEVKRRIADDRDFQNWTTSHFQQIAGLPEHLQVEVLDEFANQYETPEIQKIAKYVTELLRPLSKAKWQFEEITEIEIDGKKKKVQCSSCRERSSFQPGLFDGTTDPEELKKNDKCLNSKCWMLRTYKSMQIKAEELKKVHPKLVCLAEDISVHDGVAEDLRELFKPMIFRSQYRIVKKTNPQAKPALVVYGPNCGKIKYIVLNTVNGSVNGTPMGGADKSKDMKTRKKELEGKRWFSVLRQMMKAIGKTSIKNVKIPKDKDEIFMALKLAVFIGTDEFAVKHNNGSRGCYGKRNVMTKFTKSLTGQNVDKLAAMLFETVKPNLISEVTYGGPITQTRDDDIASAKAIAKMLGLNIAEMYKQACIEYPVPKSWKAEKNARAKKTIKVKEPICKK